MLQFKEEPRLSEKGRARRLIILLSFVCVTLHGAYPSAILILPCSLDVGDKLYQNY